MKDLSQHLFSIFSSEKFLSMRDLGNETPIFVQPYQVADEDHMTATVRALVSRLRNAGIETIELNLFSLLLEELRDGGLLDEFLAGERSFDRSDLFNDLKNHADPKTRLVPRLVKRMEAPHVKLTLLTGVGHVFPFMRAHTLLDSIQPAMVRQPVVMFFPGEYIQVNGRGSQLQLFGSLPAKGYYRARNLNRY